MNKSIFHINFEIFEFFPLQSFFSFCSKRPRIYSQALTINNTLYISGFLGTDPVSGQLVIGGIEAQCRQVLANMKAVLQAAGANFTNGMTCCR